MGPLVGREHELSQLTRILDDVDGGLGQLAFLVGEAGIGKTRLAEEVARRATARGFQVAWGRAWEGGGTPAFWPWTQIVRALATPARPAPGLAASVERPLDRFELFDSVARFCAEMARERPAVIVLEDLHAADRSSLALLDFIATQLRNLRVAVIGTYRDAELQLLADSGVEMARAARRGRTLSLARLDRSELGVLARAMGITDDAAADRVHRATDGHPFFACEMFGSLRTRPGADAPIPHSVRAAVTERLAVLGDGGRPIIEAAAAYGRDVAPSVLAELAGAAVDHTLAAATHAGILEETAGGYRFVHALVCETIHDGLSPARRAELHRAIAEVLERRPGDDPPLDEIAHHYLAAGPARIETAVRAACAAAERCIRRLAYDDASALVDRALAAAEAAPPDLALRAELLLVAGTARLRAGDDAGGRRACDDAATAARRLGSPELLARAALAYGAVFRPAQVDPLLVGMLEEALRELAPGRTRALVEARLAGALQPAFDPEVPIAMARTAIASARDLDPASRLAVLVGAGAALQDVGDPVERIEVDRETLVLAIDQRDLALTIRARQRLVFDHISLGDPAAADREIAVLVHQTADLAPRWRWPVALLGALRAACDARFDDVERELARAQQLLGPQPDASMTRCLRLRAFFEAVLRDQVGLLAPRWRDVAPLFHQRPLPELCTALVHVRAGELDEARAVLRSASRAAIVAFAADPPTSIVLAEVLDGVGDAELAADVVPRVEPLAGRIAVWSWLAMTCLGPTERALALLARARGRFDEADRWFADAEARATSAGLELHLPRLHFERGATALAAREHARAFVHLARAATSAERLGMTELGARIAAATAAATAAPVHGASPIAAEPNALALRREGELWLVTRGDMSVRVKDSRGLQLLARLVDVPDREIHVLELASDSGEAIDTGDAGDVIDPEARAAYRRRIGELREQLDDAEAANDLGRAGRARAELEVIEAELVAAVGLGGRGRRAASATERARSNVQRRLADAIRKIGLASPESGRHLEQCVRTGIYCRYSPANPRRS